MLKKKNSIGNASGWWDEQLVEWNENLNGVNIPNHWVKKERGPWLRALQELLQWGYAHQTEHQCDVMSCHAISKSGWI